MRPRVLRGDDQSERLRQLEQERAEQLLTARRLAAIVESSDDAIISKSLDGVIQSWNASAERLFGYTAEQAVGRHISLVIPPERIAEEDQIVASLKAERRIEHFETERVRADGRRIQVSLTISPIKDEQGRVVGASKIVRDITDRKRVEESLRTLAQNLSEADQRKNEFLAMLAHELRTPLAPISNAVRALRTGGIDPDEAKAALTMLGRQVTHLGRLVDDLLDVSRISRGRIELRREDVELEPIVQQSVDAARSTFGHLGHDLTVDMPDAPVWVNADPARLAQVIGNLLNNAGKFTDRGGRVRLTIERDGPEVVIRVRDSGIGIASDQIAGLFEMFRQGDATLERTRDGLGIGLALVKTLVEMHGGRISAHSAGPGQGSEFTVRLPVVGPPSVVAPSPVTVQPPGGHRILIVDDNEDGAESLALLLRVGGYDTYQARDGVEGIAAVERVRPDAVLLDIGLPKLNGYEACRRIRTQPWGRDLLIVALTGWGMDEDRARSRDAGFNAHMVKPVDYDALLALLASLPPAPPSRA